MTSSIYSFSVDETLKNQFVSVAENNDFSGEQLIREFMRTYVEQHSVVQQPRVVKYDDWFAKKVKQSLASIESGNTLTHAEVEAKFAALHARDTTAK